MNEKYLLELLATGRLSVDETLTLMGKNDPQAIHTHQDTPKKITRNKPIQRTYSIEDHYHILRECRLHNGNVSATARKLKIPAGTIKNHLRYAGMLPCNTRYDIERCKDWRRRRGMYLDLPLEIGKAISALGVMS